MAWHHPHLTTPPHWASEGATMGQGQRPGWPLISRHVWTRTHTMWTPKQLIRIWMGWKRAKGLWTVARVYLCVYVCAFMLLSWWPGQWLSDHQTFPQAVLHQPRCAALVPGVFVRGQEGGITPGMIPYYWPTLPLWFGLVLLTGSGFHLLPVLPPVSWSLWCPHTLTTKTQIRTF